jgi:transcriptional regulator with XRE-family HTH domain
MAATGSDRARIWLREFGEQVRRLRTDAGLSQAELAERAQIHVTYLSSLERGGRNVSLVNIRAIAAALGRPPGDLFAG